MARIAYHGQIRIAAAQLDGYVPLRHIAVDMLAVGAETSVYGTQTVYAGIIPKPGRLITTWTFGQENKKAASVLITDAAFLRFSEGQLPQIHLGGSLCGLQVFVAFRSVCRGVRLEILRNGANDVIAPCFSKYI